MRVCVLVCTGVWEKGCEGQGRMVTGSLILNSPKHSKVE